MTTDHNQRLARDRHTAKARGIDPDLVPFYLRVRALISPGNSSRGAAVAIARWVTTNRPRETWEILVVTAGARCYHMDWVHPAKVLDTFHRKQAAILIPASWVGEP